MNQGRSDIDSPSSDRYRIVAFATQGSGGDDAARLRELLREFNGVDWFSFDRQNKKASARLLLRKLWKERPDLVVMEGTGIGGGIALLLARLRGIRYVISSGDAVGPFVSAIRPFLGPLFGAYERLLYRFAAGFIGWSPYLVGRALTFGVPRAMTAPGWAPFSLDDEERAFARNRIRDELGIPHDAIVLGIVGSLAWTGRVGYCYGHELVQALKLVQRPDVWVVIVGDGDGRERLQDMIDRDGLNRCLLTGRVARSLVPAYLATFDIASLPQSLDGVGSFRYTTKISEYLAARIPIVTGHLPLAYDLDSGWIWQVDGEAPWKQEYVQALACFIQSLDAATIAARTDRIPSSVPEFEREAQVERVTRFIQHLLAGR